MVPRSTLSDIGLEELPHGQLINEEPYVSLHALSPSVQSMNRRLSRVSCC